MISQNPGNPILSQILDLPSSNKILLLNEGEAAVSGKGKLGRFLARRGKGGEVQQAQAAVSFLAEQLNIPLADRHCISVRKAQEFIRHSLMPSSDEEAMGGAEQPVTTVGAEGLATASASYAPDDSYSLQAGAMGSDSEYSASDSEEEVPVKRKANKKGQNVQFAETLIDTKPQPSQRVEDPFDVLLDKVQAADEPATELMSLYEELSPEEMVEFRQYLQAQYSLEQIEAEFKGFWEWSAKNICMKMIKDELLRVPVKEIEQAISYYSDQGSCYRHLLQIVWLKIHLGNSELLSMCEDVSSTIKETANELKELHNEQVKKIHEIAEQYKIRQALTEAMACPLDEPDREDKIRAAWAPLFRNDDARNVMFEKMGLSEWTKNRLAHKVVEDLALTVRNEIINQRPS